ncbi:Rieske Fe-S protein [Streptomyces sp. V3I8]|uniref:QcrA and Rieske domain-containing protein n=1 Tax=Streptomyces sp. V3I8 TaxID=3042279 RepID=UPI00278A35B1|nr:Rieske (2Fe-2S) protein [Streptomyces sp. V3I8]MDQ1039613.1 Rieske Fe-S protein [Streptomyces sp. V3I8]
MTDPLTGRSPRRRTVLATGATGALLLGCSRYGGEDGGGGGGAQEAPTVPPGGKELVKAGEVPVGGGKVLKDEKVVVTQPEEGDFKAFSAVCTHEGCIVAEVADGTIDCTCHGSRFRVADGSVAGGPAPKPLAARRIEVEGDSIRLV